MNDTQRVTLCIYAKYPCGECRYAECHYTELRGALVYFKYFVCKNFSLLQF
jgi:hypothetical protein